MMRALITGITGQDGSYLAEHLLGLGYEVHGTVRPVASEDQSLRLGRIQHLLGKVKLHPGDITNYADVIRVIAGVKFDECYHLAAQSFVGGSFEDGFSTMRTNIDGTHYMLEAIRQWQPACRVYFAGSSEMFGSVCETPQRETTPFHPRSPYGISKVAGFNLARYYREAYGMACCSGILFNHESPRRGSQFVTRKITQSVARIALGQQSKLMLGNLDAKRDWGHAKDYVQAMHQMLQRPTADDYVVASGESHSVREFCSLAFATVNLNYQDYVVQDDRLLRPAEVDLLCGDASKARRILGWSPRYSFQSLIQEMVYSDLDACKEEQYGR